MDRNEMPGDQIVMQAGRVMVTRKAEMTPMEEGITLPDGTQVMIDGTVMMPDGTMRMLADGETMSLQGMPASPEDMTDRQFKENMEDEELRDDIH